MHDSGEGIRCGRITFAKGAGDTPDDYYVVYIDRATAHLKIVYYVVTYH
jgi:hypothetical protein